MNSYRDLIVWQKGMGLAAALYRLTRAMPRAEAYRLSGQMIRAAAAVPANISKGSLAELETFLLLVEDLQLAPPRIVSTLQQAEEVGKMLTSLRARLSASPRTQHPAPSSSRSLP